MKSPTEWESRVERGRELGTSPNGLRSSKGDDFGFFFLHMPGGREQLRVMVSSGDEEMPWEHVSVSLRTRCPTWQEMAWVKSLFWRDDECVVQYHPPKADYVSFHPYCLHMWRPLDATLPRPPTVAVGPLVGKAVPR